MSDQASSPRTGKCGTLLVLGLFLAAAWFASTSEDAGSDGDGAGTCPPCGDDPCFDGSPMRPINATCCTCPPEVWEMYENDYPYREHPQGLRTVRLYYEIQPDQAGVDMVYGTPDHPIRMPPAYQAFPYDYVNGAYLDYRLGNVGGVNPAFYVAHGDAALGYVIFDSWLTVGDISGILHATFDNRLGRCVDRRPCSRGRWEPSAPALPNSSLATLWRAAGPGAHCPDFIQCDEAGSHRSSQRQRGSRVTNASRARFAPAAGRRGRSTPHHLCSRRRLRRRLRRRRRCAASAAAPPPRRRLVPASPASPSSRPTACPE